jgi:hypothetical protein
MSEAKAGKVTRAYLFTCIHCGESQSYRYSSRPITLREAEREARRDGWTKTNRGWAHKSCAEAAAQDGSDAPKAGVGSEAGKAVRAYLFACTHCKEGALVYRLGRPITLRGAERAARENSWTKTGQGWAHKCCVSKCEG